MSTVGKSYLTLSGNAKNCISDTYCVRAGEGKGSEQVRGVILALWDETLPLASAQVSKGTARGATAIK